MNPKRRRAGAGAAVLAAGGLLAGTVGEAAAQITADQARAAALAHVPGTVLEFELERAAGGGLVYEFEILRNGVGPVAEVLVRADGTVLSDSVDDGDGPGDVDGPFDDD